MKTRTAFLSLVVALAGVPLFANDCIWTTAAAGEAIWSDAGNWQASTPPGSGDNASFPTAPAGGRLLVQVPQQQNVALDTLSGVDGYDIKLGGWTTFTVRDPSGFFGTLGYRGWLNDYANLVLSASEAFTPHVNVLDAGYGLKVSVSDANASAEIGFVTNAVPGLMDKWGAGKLRAKFSQSDASNARVAQGELAVHGTASVDAITVAAGAALGVEDSLYVRNLGVEGASLAKTGGGKLTIGSLHSISGSQTGFSSAPAGIAVSAGSLALAAPAAADAGAIATAPRLHLDASAAGAFVTETSGGDTLVATWNGVGDGAIPATGVAANSGRKPRLVADGLNGMPIVDCGAFVGDGNAGDGTTGYLAFPDSAVREGFMVVRAKSTGIRYFLLGSSYNWIYDFHTGPDGQLTDVANANSIVFHGVWRVDGALVNAQNFTLGTNFHLVSFSLPEARGNLNALALDREYRFGGLEYAEVILYDQVLSADERRAVESSLMAKWLPREGVSLGTLAFGSGVAAGLETDVDVDIAFLNGTGTFVKSGAGAASVIAAAEAVTGLSVQGGSLSITGEANPLSITNDAIFHIDPSATQTLTMDGNGLVTQIADVRANGRSASTSPHSTAAGPSLVASPTGLDLLDFGTFSHDVAQSQADTCGMKWSDRRTDVYAGFVVIEKKGDHDSFVLGDPSDYHFHADSGTLLNPNYSDYRLRTPNGTVWTLDGVEVDPLATTWPAGLHVVSFCIPDTRSDGVGLPGVNAGMFAQDRELCRIGGMRYGEVLIFNRTLSATQVAAVSSYLREKWLGSSKDTSNGFQALSVAAGASLNFAGDVTIADNSTLAVECAKTGAGTIVVGGDVLLGTNVTVSATGSPQGSVALVTAASFENEEALSTWTVEGASKLKPKVVSGVLCVVFPPPGTLLQIR
ncbi:MAG: hypothetical protein ACOX9C_11135 [Kiritimatiellia bacterium]|jgi:hypothetical protein